MNHHQFHSNLILSILCAMQISAVGLPASAQDLNSAKFSMPELTVKRKFAPIAQKMHTSIQLSSGANQHPLVPLPNEQSIVPLPNEQTLVPLPNEHPLVPLPNEQSPVPLPNEHPLAPPTIEHPLAPPANLTANQSTQQASPISAHNPADDIITEITLPTAFLKCTQFSKAYVSDDCATLEVFDGELFVMDKKPVQLICKGIHMSLTKDSMIVVSAGPHVSKVHSLSMKPIALVANGYSVKLSIGEELICADSMSDLQSSAQADAIERRLASVVHFDGTNDRILKCEYSPLSMMKNSAVFRDVFHSKQHGKRLIADRLLKVAVSLAVATAAHGLYLPVAPDAN